MSTQTTVLWNLIGRSFTDPRGIAQMLNALRLERGVLWMMLAAVVCLSVLGMAATLYVFPQAQNNPMLMMSPLSLAVVLASVLVMMIFAFYFTGQMLGGTGRFPGALLLLTWWQAMALVVQVAQMVAMLVFPLLGMLVSLAGFVYLIGALVVAVQVLHGFPTLAKAVATVVIAFLGTVFGMALILTLIGVTAQGGGL